MVMSVLTDLETSPSLVTLASLVRSARHNVASSTPEHAGRASSHFILYFTRSDHRANESRKIVFPHLAGFIHAR